MKRRPYGRDLGLTIRMGSALVPIVVWYLLITALLILVAIAVHQDPSWETLLGLGVFALGGPIALGEQFLNAEGLGLRAARAKEVKPGGHTELQALVGRVAPQADLHPPRLATARSWAPNALSVGLTERGAIVVFASELLRRNLTPGELEAVVANDLAHIANRDGVVMTFVSAPALLGKAA
jgi:heat shock protein HtpX